MKIDIRAFLETDWREVSEIYHQGLLSRNATFETQVPEYNLWITKFRSNLLWVAVEGKRVVGWAGLQSVSARTVYKGVMEVTIYVHQEFGGKGIGTQLMQYMVTESERVGIWTLHSSIFPENTASIQLHLRHGFREIGYRERIAQLDGVWRNTVLLERRSKIIGI